VKKQHWHLEGEVICAHLSFLRGTIRTEKRLSPCNGISLLTLEKVDFQRIAKKGRKNSNLGGEVQAFPVF
jgi:hypothetical protein